MIALRNGVAVADAGIAGSRALHYGDGVFRTLLHWRGAPLDWQRQMDKLAADCSALALDVPDAALLRQEVDAAAVGAEAAVVKIIVAREAGGRGYRSTSSVAERWVIAYPPPPAGAQARDGIRVDVADLQLSAQPKLAGVKHLNRLEQVLASRDWPQDIDERLLCDERGQLVCGTRSNLFCVSGGRLLTPALDRCGVTGIMRGKLIELARTLGIEVVVAALEPSALRDADEVFVCNAVIGLWPVRELDAKRWPIPGPLTRRLMQALAHPTLDTPSTGNT